MNDSQKRHTIKRIQDMAAAKIKVLDVYINQQYMTHKEKHDAIKHGQAKLLPFSDKWEGGDWFDFPLKKKYSSEYEKKKQDREKRIGAVRKEAQRIIDLVQLKDLKSDTGMDLIEKFDKFQG